MSLYNTYRPQEFSEVIGNEATVSYLETIAKDKKRSHVFLLHGPTGCGKTTLARIAAKEIGCSEQNTTEIDSATFRGIDTVRELRKTSRFQSISGGDRVWIIDEIHKMTTDAQNALLKLLEDHPTNCYYILCTTEPEKLLPTVRGRTIQLEVKQLTDSQMFSLLKRVVKGQDQKLKKSVYDQIIEDSFGLPRNAIQILEKVLTVPPEQQLEIARDSASKQNASIELCKALLQGAPWKKVSGILKGLKDQEAESIRRHVLGYAQAVLLKASNDKAAHILEEFIEPFYNSGFPGLVLATYSVIKG